MRYKLLLPLAVASLDLSCASRNLEPRSSAVNQSYVGHSVEEQNALVIANERLKDSGLTASEYCVVSRRMNNAWNFTYTRSISDGSDGGSNHCEVHVDSNGNSRIFKGR